MKFSKSLIKTQREAPSNCDTLSQSLMFKTGMIKQESAGLYTYLPYFNMLLQKVEDVIRKGMNQIDGQECKFPILVSRDLLEQSNRWTAFGKEMFSLSDRNGTEYALSPTNEEAAAMIAKQYVTSFRDLPLTVYQINTKHRDEIRPRGIGRTRAFTMKDAYSFHSNDECLHETYTKIVDQYIKIFKNVGLDVFPVNADNGSMGGSGSQEIMAQSLEGDNDVCKCTKCGYAANLEVFACCNDNSEISTEKNKYNIVETPNVKTIEELVNFFNTNTQQFAKSIVYKTEDNQIVVAVVRGDRNVNDIKLRNVLKVKGVELATAEDILSIGSYVGFVGPVKLNKGVKIIVDNEVKSMKNFIVGANKKDYHLANVNCLDFDSAEYADIRFACKGDKHTCGGDVEIIKATELGHCFKLGKRYTEKLNVTFVDNNNKSQTMTMGCYGIGLERTVVSIIDKYHDEKGLTLPMPLAPFKVDLIYNDKYADVAEEIYNKFIDNNIDTLLDDRKGSFGVKFKDAELLGIPLKVIFGKNFENDGLVEIEPRLGDKISVEKENLVCKIKEIIKEETEKFYNR